MQNSQYIGVDPLINYRNPIYNSEEITKVRQHNIRVIANHFKLIELKSDYFGASSFYYDPEHKIMYEVDNTVLHKEPKFRIVDDKHIKKLNGIF